MASGDEEDVPLGSLLRAGYEAVMDYVLGRLATEGFADVRPAHLAIFQHLDPDGTRIGELASRARLTNQSVGYLVDSLEEFGYVERVAVPGDRRGRVVRLTLKGWEEMAACGRALTEIEKIWSEQLGAQRFGELRRILAELYQT
jgi:DNA-binding MarR family transcriptional regulator